MSVDKDAMRRDFEAGMTFRALALKYGCSPAAVAKYAKKGDWARGGDREQVNTAFTPAESTDKAEPTDFTTVQTMAHKLLDRARETLDDPKQIGARDLRSLAAMLLDIRSLLNAVSPLEAEEQRLRLESMRRQIEDAGEQNSREVTVRFVDTEGAEQ